MSFTVDGQEPGATLHLSHPGQIVRIRAEAQCVKSFDGIEVLLSGKIMPARAPAHLPHRAVHSMDCPMRAAASELAGNDLAAKQYFNSVELFHALGFRANPHDLTGMDKWSVAPVPGRLR